MEFFKIEKGVPHRGRSRQYTHLFETMEVGDSFALPADKADSVRGSANQYARLHDRAKKFSVMRQADGNFRCFRIK